MPNKSVNPTDSIEIASHLDSGSSSGDQELPDIPNPMPELSLRRTIIKSDQGKILVKLNNSIIISCAKSSNYIQIFYCR